MKRNISRTIAAFGLIVPSALLGQAIGDVPIDSYFGKGEQLEVRALGDLSGDKVADIAFISASEDSRTLKVLRTEKGEFDIDFATVGTLKLDTYPKGAADLSIAKGVLKIVDLVGGTTATQTTYRYRYDPAVKKMRLIGLDATNYSNTYAHDGYEISWNLLTGDLITRDMKLNKKGGDAAYDPIIEKKLKRVSKPLYMETTPNPDDLIESVRK